MQVTIWAIATTIIFNILSNLLTPPIQKYLANVSEARKKKIEEKKRIFENTVQYLLNNPHEQIYLRVRYAEKNIVAFMFLLAGYFFTLSTNGLLVILGIIFFIIGNYGLNRTRNMGKLVDEIWKRRKVNHPDINLD